MNSDNKTQRFVAWAVVVCLVALAIGITSIADWIAVSCLALVPPLVARSLGRGPDQAISESIRNVYR